MEIGTRVQAAIEVTVNRASQEQWQNQDTGLPKWAIFRSVGETYHFLHSTGRKCLSKSGGFEASLGMKTSSCIRYLQKSLFENMLPTEGEEHIFIKFAKK
jgi:hypothetical protein